MRLEKIDIDNPVVPVLQPGIRILDNTLRDGEQTPGVVFSKEDKLEIVKALCECNIPDAEVGFPASSASERASIKALVEHNFPIRLHGLCRLVEKDISYAIDCGLQFITLFLPGSKKYLTENLKIDLKNIEDIIKRNVFFASNAGLKVKFSCENASRMPFGQLVSYYRAAEENGAESISFPDTAGVLTPSSIFQYIKFLKAELKCNISVHCHNDLGLATANTIVAAEAGATELQTCINGLGERAGNAALEEVVMVLTEIYQYNTNIRADKLINLSALVYEKSSLSPTFNKPLFGENVFKHESAIHANSILRGENLYEPFPPSLIGRQHEIVLGKHSGLASIAYYLHEIKKWPKDTINKSKMKKILSYLKEASETKIPVDLDKFIEKVSIDL